MAELCGNVTTQRFGIQLLLCPARVLDVTASDVRFSAP